MNTLKLISEVIDHPGIEILIEENNNKKDLYIKGIFLQAEQKNKNGRLYPKNILDRQVQAFVEDYVSKHRAMGELNHPPSPSIDPERASHLITEIKRVGNDYHGKAKVLNTPIGLIVKSLIEDGVQLGVSSRGLGSLKEGTGIYKGSKVVQSDFRLVTIDIVSDPSAPGAWVNGIFESVDYIEKNGIISPIDMHKIKRARDSQYIMMKESSSELERIKIAEDLVKLIDSFSNVRII